ncbi:MAG: hypothetical protein ACHP9Z_13395 [Streptosporangiales bacterium]
MPVAVFVPAQGTHECGIPDGRTIERNQGEETFEIPVSSSVHTQIVIAWLPIDLPGARSPGIPEVNSAIPACCYGPLGEAEHVRASRVFGAALALFRREFAIRVNLAFESPQERLAGGPRPSAAVGGATP